MEEMKKSEVWCVLAPGGTGKTSLVNELCDHGLKHLIDMDDWGYKQGESWMTPWSQMIQLSKSIPYYTVLFGISDNLEEAFSADLVIILYKNPKDISESGVRRD